MKLQKSDIVKIKDATLESVLDEMGKVAAGDVVMLVCHG